MPGDANLPPDLLKEFLAESEELLEGLVQDLVLLDQGGADPEIIQRIFRGLHTIKGNAGFVQVEAMVRVSHRAEDLVAAIRAGQSPLTAAVVDALLLTVDLLRRQLESLQNPGETPPSSRQVEEALAALQTGSPASPGSPVGTPETPGAVAESTPEGEMQTLRVDVHRIDRIMDQLGELVLERNRLQQVALDVRNGRDVPGLAQLLSDTAGRIHSITGEIQVAVLKVRMVPVERIFRKFPRVVRDLCGRLGKDVSLVVVGGETELDKSVAELIVDPLTHLVRNSLDHGLETPEERRSAGKSPQGTLELSAAHEGNHILIRVRDDGRGIDQEAVRRKARSLGLVAEDVLANMDSTELLNLLFLPGFSTCDSVTEFSGRGVGLDVVRSRLKSCRGMIELHSEPGVGTQIVLRLPLTLAIIPSLFFEVGGDRYAVPLSSVIEVVNDEPQLSHCFRGQSLFRWRERVIPLVGLAERFQVESSSPVGSKLIVLGLAEKQIALRVDRLIGQEEVVIKPLGELLGDPDAIAGGTILGDGRVALILDVGALMSNEHAANGRRAIAA